MSAFSWLIGSSATGSPVVPRQDVHDDHVEAQLLALRDHVLDVGRRILRGRKPGFWPAGEPLGDVVDTTLDDQHIGILGAIREAYCDLVGSLPENAAVGKVELGILLRSPVLELALLVFAKTELLSHLRDPGHRAVSPL